MAKDYTHLTRGERERIRLLRLEKYSIGFIAAALGRSKSTIWREVKSHLHHNGYEPERAHGHAQKLRKKPRRPCKMMLPEIARFVKEGLNNDWSPEQIAGRMRLHFPRRPDLRISHQCIYDWLYRDKKSGGIWYQKLRINNHKRRKWKVKMPRRVNISRRKGIGQRPKSVETRRFFGDWEADTVEGKLNRGRLVTLVERKTLYTLITGMGTRHAHNFNAAAEKRIRQEPWLPLRTLTVDNGAEFARHEELERTLGLRVYFAEPYSFWQRGVNENTNGLLRQYLPQKTDFLSIPEEEIARVEKMLNNRPRKKLNYRTPSEVMAKIASRHGVSLGT